MNPSARARPRVLQCITRLGLGGSERVAFSLMHELASEIDFALFTTCAGNPDPVGQAMEAELKALGIPWFQGTKVPMKACGMVPGAWALRRCIETLRPDFIHYHSETPEACGAMMTLLSQTGARIPAIRTIHNSIFWRYWPRMGRWCDHRLKKASIACVSEAAREEFVRYRQDSGVSPSATPPVVIYNGVPLIPHPPHRQPHNPSVRRVLFAGRFEWQKGPDILCAALPLVRLEPGICGELVVHGQGAYEPALRTLAANPPPQWTVTVLPPMAGLKRLLPEFDLLVMPSRFEGLGLVAIEATLCGLPVVATDAPGLREALPPDHLWLAQPESAAEFAVTLTRALRETDRWEPSVTAAQQYAQARFTPRAMAASYRKLYTKDS